MGHLGKWNAHKHGRSIFQNPMHRFFLHYAPQAPTKYLSGIMGKSLKIKASIDFYTQEQEHSWSEQPSALPWASTCFKNVPIQGSYPKH